MQCACEVQLVQMVYLLQSHASPVQSLGQRVELVNGRQRRRSGSARHSLTRGKHFFCTSHQPQVASLAHVVHLVNAEHCLTSGHDSLALMPLANTIESHVGDAVQRSLPTLASQ
jgi:hypothetical protein